MKAIVALLLLAASADAQVQQTTEQLGQSDTWVTAFRWTADSSGNVPITPAVLRNCCQGYIVTQIEISPGTPAPSAGYSVVVIDQAGVDLLEGTASSNSATQAVSYSISSAATPIQGTFSLLLTGQTVPSAQGVVYVFITKSAGTVVSRVSSSASSVISGINGAIQASDFNFAPQSPAGTLIAGSNSLILRPVPLGVNGTDTAHELYVYGTGTPEPCLITGGTAVSGAKSGAITIACSNSHPAGYQISSVAGGLPEALNYLPGGNGTVQFNPSYTVQVHGKVTLPASGRSTIDGMNSPRYVLYRASDYPNGNMFEFPTGSTTAVVNMWMGNDTVSSQTSGSAFHYQHGANAYIRNINVVGGYIGFDFDGTSQIAWTDSGVTAAASPMFAAVYIHDSSGVPYIPVNSQFNGGFISLNPTSEGMLIEAADVIQINSLAFGGGGIHQLHLSLLGTSDYLTGIYVNNCIFDNATNWPIKIDGTGSMSNIHFTGGEVVGDANVSQFNGIDVGYSDPVTMNNWSITGMDISSIRLSGIAVGAGAVQGAITGNVLHGNNAGNTGGDGGIKLASGVSDLTITGNRITNTNAAFTGHQQWGVGTIAGGSNVSIVGNNVLGNVSIGIGIYGTFTDSVVSENLGYNPVGTSTLTCDASPCTLPATPALSPSVLYLAGGTVSSVKRGGSTVCTATPCAVTLPPLGQAVITHAGAPTTITLDVQ